MLYLSQNKISIRHSEKDITLKVIVKHYLNHRGQPQVIEFYSF